MRTVRVSLTLSDQLNELLDQNHPALFSASRMLAPDLGRHIYPVTDTPLVLHNHADRSRIDPGDSQW